MSRTWWARAVGLWVVGAAACGGSTGGGATGPVLPHQPPQCAPSTCAQQNKTCGTISDGCGGTLTCGTCQAGETCGGGGSPNICGGNACTPKTCAQLGATCGAVSDGCGSVLACGDCASGQTCGGGGTANVCGTPSPAATAPDAPTHVTATPQDGQALVQWAAPAKDGGSAITSYVVTALPTGAQMSTSSLSLVFSGLQNGTTYWFKVHAVNAVGSSSDSVWSNAVTPVDACTGLTPTPGTGVTFVTDTLDPSTSCDGVTSDRSGDIAALATLNQPMDHLTTLYALSSQGTLHRKFSQQVMKVFPVTGGWLTLWNDGHPTPSEGLTALWSDGSVASSVNLPWGADLRASENPTGGIVALQVQGSSQTMVSYDANAHLLWSVGLPAALRGAPLRTLGVDRQGNTLALFNATDGSPIVTGLWFDAQGSAGEPFTALTGTDASESLTLVPRSMSGFFLRKGMQWTTSFDTLSRVPQAAPQWLASRPSTGLRVVRGEQGYAVYPLPQSQVCLTSRTIETVASTGKSCGSLQLKWTASTCGNLNVSVGPDGTVALGGESSHPDTSAVIQCAYQWWPRLLR